MKRIVQIVLLSFAATTLAFGQPKKPPTDEQIIKQIEQDWGVALVKKDMAFIDAIEAPLYMFTDPDGTLFTKAEANADLKSGAAKITAFKIDDMQVKVFSGTAVVYGLETEKSTYKGADTSGQYRFTDVFMYVRGTWTAIATHVSKVVKH
jgi:hypothetical protein